MFASPNVAIKLGAKDTSAWKHCTRFMVNLSHDTVVFSRQTCLENSEKELRTGYPDIIYSGDYKASEISLSVIN